MSPARSARRYSTEQFMKGKGKRLCLLLVIIGLVCFHYQECSTYTCHDCGSHRFDYQWYLGLWPDFSIPVTVKSEHVAKTHGYIELFPNSHHHRWEFSQRSPYYLFATKWGGCGLGSQSFYLNDFQEYYESTEGFRSFVRGKVSSGNLAEGALVKVYSMSTHVEEDNGERQFIENLSKLMKTEYTEYIGTAEQDKR